MTTASIAFWLHGTDQRQTKLDRLRYWRAALQLQHDRLLKPDPSGMTADEIELQRRCDMHFYLVAAANLRKAALSLNDRFKDQRVASAIKALDAAAPSIKKVRDLLEHFEAYDEGTGREQKLGRVPAHRMAETYKFNPGADAHIEAFANRISVTQTTPLVIALADRVLGLNLDPSSW
jgi:hypothetical protein